MEPVTIRGHTVEAATIKDSFSRRATQFSNKLLLAFRNAGVSPDAVDIPEERVPMRKAEAKVTWYAEGRYCHYSYARRDNYAENLYVVTKLLELELQSVAEGKKTFEDFAKDSEEDEDVQEKRKEARKLLGVEEDCMDFALIDAHYKKLAKDAHPDRPNGSTGEFKKLNSAHKTLKRELE